MSAPPSSSFTVPEGFTLHKENTSTILLPASNDAFLNPVQEFNRDMSVACIQAWGDLMNEEKERKWRQTLERRAKQAEKGSHKAKKAKSELCTCRSSLLSSVRNCIVAQANGDGKTSAAEQPLVDVSASQPIGLQPTGLQAPPEVSGCGIGDSYSLD